MNGQRNAMSNSPLDSTLGSTPELADRVRTARVSVVADRPSEVLVAAFVPAPKQPPKVTQGTGSR
jgi:hypothetical protein